MGELIRLHGEAGMGLLVFLSGLSYLMVTFVSDSSSCRIYLALIRYKAAANSAYTLSMVSLYLWNSCRSDSLFNKFRLEVVDASNLHSLSLKV